MSIPAELSTLKALLDLHKQADPAFVPEYEPYFTQEHLKTKLEQLAGQVAVLHFAGHSDAEALVTDGAVVYAQHIAAILKTWRNLPALIFLNGCHNAEQVKLFHAAGVAVVVATRRAVDDGQAAGFAREFYASLFAEGGQVGVKDAFSRAGSKVLLTEKRQARSLDIEALPQADKAEWDWGLFAQRPEQEGWTLRQLLTDERPRYDVIGELVNPYQGLKSFREEDRAWFFGREALTAELCEKIPATPLFTLLGASGSGKSSLISAGVIPALRETGDWLILSTRPGFTELAEVFARVLCPDSVVDRLSEQKKLVHKLQAHDIALPDLLVSVREVAGQTRMLLFIDQFEELFTHAADQASVQAFQEHLIRLVATALPGCHLLLVMRADFLSAALANPPFAEMLDQHPTKFLGAMGQAELRAAIEKPASKQHVTIEPALTAALLDDVEHQSGSLPLLQYVLSLLWERRRDYRIVLEDYNRLGGLEKALETRANDIFNHFSASEQEQVKGVFLRLIQPGEGTEDTRRRAQLSEFSDNPAAQQVIKQLADERLITTQQADNHEAAFAEVSHEALIRHWGKLREWLEASREILRTQHQVSAWAKAWEENQRDSSWLLTGSRLAVAEDWLEKYADRANVLEQEYIRAGVAERDRQEEEREQQRQRELALQEEKRVLAEQKAEEQRKSLKKTRWLSGGMAVIAIVMVVAAVLARQRELQANYYLAKAFEEKALLALEQGNAVSSENTIKYRQAWLYALEAKKLKMPTGKDAISFESLRKLAAIDDRILVPEKLEASVVNVSTGIFSAKYSPNGKTLALGCEDGVIRIWDISTGMQIMQLKGHVSSVYELAYNPEGNILASGSTDGAIRLWNILTGKTLNMRQYNANTINALTYSPDGKTLAFALDVGVIHLLNVVTGVEVEIVSAHGDSIYTLSYSPNGKIIASGSRDGSVKLWDASNGKLLKRLAGHMGSVKAVEYSPDGKTLASAGADKTIRLWDTITGNLIKKLDEQGKPINALAYSSDGKMLASSDDNVIQLWAVPKGEKIRVLVGHSESIMALDFYKNNNTLLSGSRDNTARLWGVDNEKDIFRGHEYIVFSLSYNPNGRVLATGSQDRTIRQWDIKTGDCINILEGHEDSVLTLAYSPDGNVLASGSKDRTIRLWDALKGKEIKKLEGHNAPVYTIAYNPNGRKLASGGGDGYIKIWDAENKIELISFRGDSSSVSSLNYNKNGNLLASGGKDGIIRIWDAITNNEVRRFKGHEGGIRELKYSPDGKGLASFGDDKKIRLWDSTTGKELFSIDSYNEFIYELAYRNDGKVLASAGADKTIRLWDTTNGREINRYNGHDGAVFSVTYSPDGKSLVSAGADNVARLWRPSFAYRILLDLPAQQASEILQFLWQMKLDGLDFEQENIALTLSQNSPATSEENFEYAGLLKPPMSDESKLDQVVRFLEMQ